MPLPTYEQLSELIAVLNRGPVENPPWGDFLRQFRSLCGAKGVILMLRRPRYGDPGLSFIDGMEVTAEEKLNYANEFGALDPFVNLPDGVAMTLAELMPQTALQASEYYQRHMIPADNMQFLGMDVYAAGHLELSVRAIRGGGAPRFGEDEKRLLQLLLPHMRQLMHWWHHDQRIQSERNFYEGTLTRLAMATVFLNSDLRVVHSNPVAQLLLEGGDGLLLNKAHLRAVAAEDNQKLQALLKHAAATPPGTPALPQAITIRRRNTAFPLYLVVRPANNEKLGDNAEVPQVAVFISAPEQRMLSQEAIQQLMGFTPKEAQIVIALVNGRSLEEIADDSGVSRNTTRAHLYSVFRKTGVTQQSALVSLVMRSVMGLG